MKSSAWRLLEDREGIINSFSTIKLIASAYTDKSLNIQHVTEITTAKYFEVLALSSLEGTLLQDKIWNVLNGWYNGSYSEIIMFKLFFVHNSDYHSCANRYCTYCTYTLKFVLTFALGAVALNLTHAKLFRPLYKSFRRNLTNEQEKHITEDEHASLNSYITLH